MILKSATLPILIYIKTSTRSLTFATYALIPKTMQSSFVLINVLYSNTLFTQTVQHLKYELINNLVAGLSA